VRAQGAAALPAVLEYTGEFGAELILFLPWVNALARQGLLQGRTIRTYAGMRCFYEGLEGARIEEKTGLRHYVPLRRRITPVRDEHDFDGKGPPACYLYPDLRRRFATLPDLGVGQEFWPGDERPLLVIHNKYNHEWDGKPVNFIAPATLDRLFARLKGRFRLVYVRHGMAPPPPDFSGDEMNQLPFDDAGVLARHPGVATFDALFDAYRARVGQEGVNGFKSILYARCRCFITVQGGGAHQIALFSGSLMLILHKRGREAEWAYGDGYYGFMANPAPLRAVATSEAELLDGAALFEEAGLALDRVLVAPRHAALLERLSPWRAIAG
jgi:hypothetical protein